jgi:hypothetical protein
VTDRSRDRQPNAAAISAQAVRRDPQQRQGKPPGTGGQGLLCGADSIRGGSGIHGELLRGSPDLPARGGRACIWLRRRWAIYFRSTSIGDHLATPLTSSPTPRRSQGFLAARLRHRRVRPTAAVQASPTATWLRRRAIASSPERCILYQSSPETPQRHAQRTFMYTLDQLGYRGLRRTMCRLGKPTTPWVDTTELHYRLPLLIQDTGRARTQSRR